MEEIQNNVRIKIKPVLEWLNKNKFVVSAVVAVILVGLSAFADYKNSKAEEEVIKVIAQYQKTLLAVGGEIKYDSVECSGIFSTQCDINKVSVSFLGQEQLSAKVIRFGDIGEFARMKELKEGKTIEMDFDLSAQELSLPKPMVAEMVRQNVSEAFAQNTVEKLQNVDIEIEGTFTGNNTHIQKLELDHLDIENEIMPIRLSLVGRDISPDSLESMTLESFSIEFEDKAIADVTFESIAQFAKMLPDTEQRIFLKNFKLVPDDLKERAKASRIINNVLADEFETELKLSSGETQHRLIEALIKVLRHEADTVTIEVKNEKSVPFTDLQKMVAENDPKKSGVSVTVSTD